MDEPRKNTPPNCGVLEKIIELVGFSTKNTAKTAMFSGQERNGFWMCRKHCFGRMFAAACSFGRLCRLCAACCNWDSRVTWLCGWAGFYAPLARGKSQLHVLVSRTERQSQQKARELGLRWTVWGAGVVRWRHRTRLLRSDADASLCLGKGLQRNKRCACSLLSWAWAFPRRPHTLTRPPALGMLSVARSSYGTRQTTAHAPPAQPRIDFSNAVCVIEVAPLTAPSRRSITWPVFIYETSNTALNALSKAIPSTSASHWARQRWKHVLWRVMAAILTVLTASV